MGLGRQGDRQGAMCLDWDEIPRSRGHAFYDCHSQSLRKVDFDAFDEKLFKPVCFNKMRPSIAPGRFFACTSWSISRASTARAAHVSNMRISKE